MYQPTNEDIDTLARTLFGEARNQGNQGYLAVANVVMNRLADGRWGHTIHDVCKANRQFSCWNSEDPNLPMILRVTGMDAAFSRALAIADLAAHGLVRDNTGGACHYYWSGMKKAPHWAEGHEPSARVGAHLFFKGIP